MPKFQITRVDPYESRDDILALWRDNLPDTPDGRLDWMAENPEGASVWFFALDEESKQVAASISIMPRKIKSQDRIFLAGIVGDFIVRRQFRVFGPALALIKSVVTEYKNLGFDFLYTFPNQESEKMALRAGFQRIGIITRFAKPLKIKNQLMKYMHPSLAYLLSPGVELGLRLFSREAYIRSNGFFEEINVLNEKYDLFWTTADDLRSTLGVRSSEYLDWRYFKNPLYRFQFFTWNDPAKGNILGYVVFTISADNNLRIFDVFAGKQDSQWKLLANFLKIARTKGLDTVSIRIFQNNPLFNSIKSLGFLDRKEKIHLLFAGDPSLVPKEWIFFDGDRNV